MSNWKKSVVFLFLGLVTGIAVTESNIHLSIFQAFVLIVCAIVLGLWYAWVGFDQGRSHGYKEGWQAALDTQPFSYDNKANGLTVGSVYGTLASVGHQNKSDSFYLNLVVEESGSTHLARCVRSDIRALPKLFTLTKDRYVRSIEKPAT